MKRVVLKARGEIVGTALVDESDYEVLTGWRWHLVNGYAARAVWRLGRSTVVLMHRHILGLEPGDPREGDHINRDRLDNRRENLRIVSPDENKQNVSSHRGSTSSYRGVYWDSRRGRWIAEARLHGRKHHLGSFTSEIEAARVASAFRAVHMPASIERPPHHLDVESAAASTNSGG